MVYTTRELKPLRCCCRDCLYLNGSSSQAPLGSGRVCRSCKKKWVLVEIICSGKKRCLSCVPSSKSLCHSLSNRPISPSTHLIPTSAAVISLHHIWNWVLFIIQILARWQQGSGFNSLGGHRTSLTQGLFAVRHYTWAETQAQRQMCLLVGGGGWTQYGARANKTRSMENSQAAFQEDDLVASCVEEEREILENRETEVSI